MKFIVGRTYKKYGSINISLEETDTHKTLIMSCPNDKYEYLFRCKKNTEIDNKIKIFDKYINDYVISTFIFDILNNDINNYYTLPRLLFPVIKK